MTAPAPVNASWADGGTMHGADFDVYAAAINTLSTFCGVALSSEYSLTDTTTPSTIISATLATGSLAQGSAFRFKCFGTIQFASTSGALTFTPSLQGVASTMTPQMASQTSGAGPFAFQLEILAVIRTIGTSGTYIAYGSGGLVNAGTSIPIVPSTSPATATINTTAASPLFAVTAGWATASVSNILKIEAAVLERVA